MDVLDENGRLFGYVNIIDALVVLLVIAILLAGVSLVIGGSNQKEVAETERIVLTSKPVPSSIGNAISADVNYSSIRPGGVSGRILDVFLTPAGDNTVQISLLVSAPANQTRIGQSIGIETESYRLNTTIVSDGVDRSSLPVQQTYVSIDTTVSSEIANSIQTGNIYKVANRTVGRILAISTIPNQKKNTRNLTLLLRLDTLSSDGDLRFGGNSLSLGQSITFETGRYAVTGTITDIGNQTLAVEKGTTSAVIEGTLPVSAAQELNVGDRYVVDGESVATINSIHTYPVEKDGQMAVRFGVTLQTIQQNGERQYLGTNVREGAMLPFKTDSGFGFEGRVVRVGTTNTGVAKNRSAVLVTTTLPTATADTINVGDTYRKEKRTVATVRSVQTYPTGNPSRKRVQLGLTLQTVHLQPENRTVFLGQPLREGVTIPFVTEEYALNPTIINQGSFELVGERTTVTTEMTVSNVAPPVANELEEGMTIRRNDHVVARVTDVSTEPATVILTSESGQIFRRDHPVNRDVTLTVEFNARETRSGLWYNSRLIQIGNDVILDFDVVTVRGNITEIRGR